MNFYNDAKDLIHENISSLLASNSHLNRLDGYSEAIKVVVDQAHIDAGKNKVAVVSGGGSGHEPAFGGFVGTGMLTAAVCGDIFASPTEDAVLAAIRAVTGPQGCLVIVMNYTGDRLHFGAAVERAKAEGYKVELAINGEDCALHGKLSKAGRRGLAAGPLVMKIAGSLAAQGASLEEVTRFTQMVTTHVGTIGVASSVCHLPGHVTEERLQPGEIELGLGLHGEAGAFKQKIQPVAPLAKDIIHRIALVDNAFLPITPSDKVCISINNLGAMTPLEMASTTASVVNSVKGDLGASIMRVYSGALITSFDMKGFSVTLIKVPQGGDGEKLLELLDAKTTAPAWPGNDGVYIADKVPVPLPTGSTDIITGGGAITTVNPEESLLGRCIVAACATLIQAQKQLDELDAKVGDGDCGATLAAGGEALSAILPTLPLDNLSQTVMNIARTVGFHMGGTSGGIYKILFSVAATTLLSEKEEGGGQFSVGAISHALDAGLAAIEKYGGATPGDRTMVDALIPAAEALRGYASKGGDVNVAEVAAAVATAAEGGAKATAGMVATAGRSAYIPEEQTVGVEDPGAVGVALWLRAVADELAK